MGASLGFLLSVVGTGPEGFVDRLGSPFHEGLAQERRTLPAPMDPVYATAAFGHRRDPGVLLHFSGTGEAIPLFTKGHQ